MVRHLLLSLALPAVAFSGSYRDVTMECVSSFNWNTGNTNIYGSATRGDSNCTGGWRTNGTTLTLTGATQPRMWFKKSDGSVLTFDMRHQVVSWWMDVSQLGASFNGALYSSWTNSTDNAALAAKWYCDANDGTGNGLWCPEFDMLESNLCGYRSTSHSCVTNATGTNKPTDATWPIKCDLEEYSTSTECNNFCDRTGDGLWFTSVEALTVCSDDSSESCAYGVGGDFVIDTKRPIHAQVSFNYIDDNLSDFTTRLYQDSNLVLSQSNSIASYPGGFPTNGRMGLLAQLWNYTESAEMDWLSGNSCPYQQGEGDLPSVEDVTFTMWDIKIDDNLIIFA